MDFAFSDEQESLRESARKLFAERLPDSRLAEIADDTGDLTRPGGVDTALWGEVAQLGWLDMSDDSIGGSFLDEAVVLEEAGFALAPIPLLSTLVALPALYPVGLDARAGATVAWAEPGGAEAFGDVSAVTCTAVGEGVGCRLNGAKVDVPDLVTVRELVVVARRPSGEPVVCVLEHPEVDGVRVGLFDSTDTTRPVGEVRFVDSPGHPLPDSDLVLTAIRRRAYAGLALESVGIAQRALELATAHASTREQFGRVIGTYQAVSHRVADMYVATELARSLAYRAAWYVATSETEPGAVPDQVVDSACSAAKAAGGEAGVLACEGLIQVLGGMGMTWEHVAHRFYKRALANRSYAGGPAWHRAVVAAALLDG